MTIPSPRTVVTLGKTPGGTRVFGSRYLAYHWAWTMREFHKRYPHAEVYIMQGSYHIGFALSAGTHDRDGVLDVWVTGIEWREAERFFRSMDWYGWWRHTGSWSSPSKYHIHMISPHTPNKVGSLIPSQIAGYLAGRLGLARSVDGPDPAAHPKHVTHFSYEGWVRQLEEDKMNNVQKADIALGQAVKSLDIAIAELRAVPIGRTRVRARITGLVAARATVRAAAKFLTS
jgi:hypothetical protein